jgi:hypothetical protein
MNPDADSRLNMQEEKQIKAEMKADQSRSKQVPGRSRQIRTDKGRKRKY